MEDNWTETPKRRPIGPTEPPVRITPARGTTVPIFQFTTDNQFEPIAETEANETIVAQQEPEPTPSFGTNLFASAAAYISPNRLFQSKIPSTTTTRTIPQEIAIQAQPTDIATQYTTSPLPEQETGPRIITETTSPPLEQTTESWINTGIEEP